MTRTNIPAADEIINKYFQVGEHGFIALKDYCGGDHSVEQAARVSYGQGTRSVSDTRTLIRYLQRHTHSTPKEMTELTFHISMPIFVARQVMRHRAFNFNEWSGRYSEMPNKFYTPEKSRITKQAKDNKQGSSDEQLLSDDEYEVFVKRNFVNEMFDEYDRRIKNGWAKELARIDLPLSTYTYMYAKCDLHNLLHFLRLRLDLHAQKEVRDYAHLMACMVKRVAPLSFEAFLDYAYAAKSFSRLDIIFLRGLQQNYQSIKVDEWELEYKKDCAGLSENETKPHESIGLTNREVKEFFQKLIPTPLPNFDLDLSKAKTVEQMEKE